MSAEAATYYRHRAEDLGLAVPEILNGSAHSLLVDGPVTSPATVEQQFCTMMAPVEPFVIGGIPETYTMLGHYYEAPAWDAILELLPRAPNMLTAQQYAGRHIGPFARHVLQDGAADVWLEAFTRDELPPRAFRIATNTNFGYTRGEYEPAQAFVIAWAVGSTGRTHARLNMLQGIYSPPNHKDESYVTPRYGGRVLATEEAATMEFGRYKNVEVSLNDAGAES
jgi:hypothetical protein